MKPIYLVLNLFTIAFPLIRSFEPKIQYAKKWRSLLPAIFIVATFFILWDIIFTQKGIWGFNHDYLVGLYFFSLPLEEWIFFFSVPFASVFIYECVKYFLPNIHTTRSIQSATAILSVFLLTIGLINHHKAYTFWTFTFSSITLALIAFKNPAWLGTFWVAYFIHLIPFILINGILTGSYLEAPIVWYNDTQNLTLRILTIPIEDTVYALLLLVMNVSLYEFLQQTIKPKIKL
jgi:lycopene cyclase domain-containing protein